MVVQVDQVVRGGKGGQGCPGFHQGVQGGPGVSGRSGVKGWQVDQGSPRLGGPGGQPGGYAIRKYGVHVV